MGSFSSNRDLMEYVDAQLKMNINPAAMKTNKERMINNARMIERRSTRRHQIQVFDSSARLWIKQAYSEDIYYSWMACAKSFSLLIQLVREALFSCAAGLDFIFYIFLHKSNQKKRSYCSKSTARARRPRTALRNTPVEQGETNKWRLDFETKLDMFWSLRRELVTWANLVKQ